MSALSQDSLLLARLLPAESALGEPMMAPTVAWLDTVDDRHVSG